MIYIEEDFWYSSTSIETRDVFVPFDQNASLDYAPSCEWTPAEKQR